MLAGCRNHSENGRRQTPMREYKNSNPKSCTSQCYLSRMKSNLPTMKSRQPTIKRHQPTMKSHQPKMKSHQPKMKSHQPTINRRAHLWFSTLPELRLRRQRIGGGCSVSLVSWVRSVLLDS